MAKNYNVEKLHENIWLYKNALSDHKEILEDYKNNQKWSAWNFGTHVMLEIPGVHYDTFPDKEQFIHDTLDVKLQSGLNMHTYTESLEKIVHHFYDVTKHYVDANNFTLPNWNFISNDIAKYVSNFTPEEYIQKFHIDYQIERQHEPRYNFGLTTVTYLNDNYEGGEVVFRIFDDESEESFKEFTYTPVAGDTLVFSSTWPNFHGVKQVTKGEKYFTQLVWRFWFPGSKEWFENVEKYGEEKWKEMHEAEMFKLSRTPGYSIRKTYEND